MVAFFKLLLRGIIYTILSPLIVLILALYAVYLLFVFIYEAFRTLIVFFTGGTPFGDYKEDIKAKEILIAKQNAQLNPQPTQPTNPNIFIINGANIQQGSVDQNGNVVGMQTPNSLGATFGQLPQSEEKLPLLDEYDSIGEEEEDNE